MDNIKESAKIDNIEDNREALAKIDNIEDLRKHVDMLCELPSEDLCGIWHYSYKYFTEDDINRIRNCMKTFVGERYDSFISLPDDTFIRQYIPEKRDTVKIITYLIPLSKVDKFMRKYMPYDNVIIHLHEQKPEIKFADRYKPLEIKSGYVGIIQLHEPTPGLCNNHLDNPCVKAYMTNVLKAMKSNIHIPWGPYELTAFCNDYQYDIITEDEIIADIEAFIEKYKIIPCN